MKWQNLRVRPDQLLLCVVAAFACATAAAEGLLSRPSLRSAGAGRALLAEAEAALAANDAATARVKLLAALAAEPDHVGARVALAAIARDSGLPTEARRLVDEALARLPPNAAALNLKGLLLLDEGLLDDANAAFAAAARADGKDPVPVLNLGEVAARAGDAPKAILHYLRAVEIDPGSEAAHTRLASLHAARGEADDAILHAEAALAKNARNPRARSALGSGLVAKGDWEPAILALEEARRGLPDDDGVRQQLGIALMGAGKFPRAADVFLEALDLDDTDARSHLQLGICYYMTRNVELRGYARKEFQHVADRKPTMVDRASSYYHLALLDDDEGKTEQAENGYRLTLRTNANHVGAANNLGLLLAGRGAFADAIPYYRRALRLQPDFLAARLNLGHALLKTGKTKDAKAELEPLLALPEGDPLRERAKKLLPPASP